MCEYIIEALISDNIYRMHFTVHYNLSYNIEKNLTIFIGKCTIVS